VLVACGGDGTVNEVASALAFRDATLAIIPSGSGNGLARELRIPLDPDRAFDVAFGGRERRIDAGELDHRLFFNIAGIGLDAVAPSPPPAGAPVLPLCRDCRAGALPQRIQLPYRGD
jgi:diacylglycerol kinase family enzyme